MREAGWGRLYESLLALCARETHARSREHALPISLINGAINPIIELQTSAPDDNNDDDDDDDDDDDAARYNCLAGYNMAAMASNL